MHINTYVCCMCFRYMHICIGRIIDESTGRIIHESPPHKLTASRRQQGRKVRKHGWARLKHPTASLNGQWRRVRKH